MKKYTIIFGMAFISVAYVGCKSAKIDRSTNKNETGRTAESDSTRSGQVVTKNENNNNMERDGVTNVAQHYNGYTGSNIDVTSESTEDPIVTTEDYSKMFKELNMSQNQIDEFERAMKDFGTRQRNNPNGEMMGTLASERQRQLRQILSKDQYAHYEQWIRSN